MGSILNDPYPEVELAPPPRAFPLVQPRVTSPTRNSDEITLFQPRSSIFSREACEKSILDTEPCRPKHESYDLSGSTFLITSTGRTLKLPVPSDSPADPLNWSNRKTSGAMFAIALFSVVCLTAAQAATVILEGIQLEFREQIIAPWLIKALVTAPTLFMGIGCFLWVPLSIGMGRRPTVLMATVVLLLALAYAGHAQSFSNLVCAVCFLGLSEGLGLSLILLIIIDLTFIDQRAQCIALMWSIAGCLGTSGVAFVPVISHYGQHWRHFYFYWMLPAAVSLVVTLFLFPETYFKRPTVAFDGLILMQSATEKLTIYQDKERDSSLYRDLPEYPVRPGFAGLRDRLGLSRSPFASWAAAGRCFIQMGYCVVNPLIFWVFVASAFNSASMVFIGGTYARILIAPPYNVSRNVVGTVNVASGVGALFGFLIWSLVIGKLVTRLSKRNRGILEAEHYLIGYIVPIVAGALSSALYGAAVQQQWPSQVFYFSYGLNGFSFVTLMIVNTLWVTEAFPRWAAPALAVVEGGCYLLAFGMSFAMLPWIEAHGFRWVGIELMILQIMSGFVAMPVAFWGKSARQAIQGRWAEDRSGALRPL